MFKPEFVETVKAAMIECCANAHPRGANRKTVAQKVIQLYTSEPLSENDVMSALTILVPSRIPGYVTRPGRGGGYSRSV